MGLFCSPSESCHDSSCFQRCPGTLNGGLLLKLFYLLKKLLYVLSCKRKPHVCRWPEEGIRHPRAEATGACDLQQVGAGHQTPDPCESSMCPRLTTEPPLQSLLSVLSTRFLPHLGNSFNFPSELPELPKERAIGGAG